MGSSVTPARQYEWPAGWTRSHQGRPARGLPASHSRHCRCLRRHKGAFSGERRKPLQKLTAGPGRVFKSPPPPSALGVDTAPISCFVWVALKGWSPGCQRLTGIGEAGGAQPSAKQAGPTTPQTPSAPSESEGSSKVLCLPSPPQERAPTRPWKHAGTAARKSPPQAPL